MMFMIIGLVILVAIMLAKVMDLLQFKSPGLIPATSAVNTPAAFTVSVLTTRPSDSEYSFIFTGLALVNSSLLRLLAILIGGAIAFVGLAVSFFVHQKATSLDAGAERGSQQKATVALATNSPGLVAVVIGAAVIIVAVVTKTTHTFAPGETSGEGIALPRTLPPRSELHLPPDDTASVPEK